MSTENEGTAVPSAPPAPPVPVDTPAASGGSAADAQDTPTTAFQAPPPGAQDGPAPEHGGSTGDAAGQGPEQTFGQVPAGQAEAGQVPAGQPSAPVPPADPQNGSGAWPPPPPAQPGYGGGQGYGGGPGYGGWGSSWQQTPAPKPGGGRRGLIAAVIVAALVAGGVGGGLGYGLARNNDESTGSTTVSASGGDSVKRDPGTIAGVAARALPSTVTIEAEGTGGEGGTGTGFVFDKQGHIITNNHVVADAVDGGKLSATFPDGKKYDAEVVGHAQGYDVAVIKLKNAPSGLNPLPIGDSDKVAVGDPTIAIGAPFGLSNTVTTGIISAKNRPVASSDGSASSKASYMSALQTDASINPGNSGGPLLSSQGAVIGINSAIQSTSSGGFGTGQAGSVGLGFAIPINQAKYVAQQLIENGKPVYAKIGASVSLEEGAGGAKITDQGVGGADAVEPGGPAAKAGLRPGDVITKLDDHPIDSGPTLIGEIWTHKPGDQVTVTYERGGQERTAQLTLASRAGDS